VNAARIETAALSCGPEPSIFFYHPKWLSLPFVASSRKRKNPLKPLMLLAMLCFQWFREKQSFGFNSRRLHHINIG
jgi:hypothetical protein